MRNDGHNSIETDLGALKLLRHTPVVQIAAQPPVTNTKVQLLGEFGIFRDVQRIEHGIAPVCTHTLNNG